MRDLIPPPETFAHATQTFIPSPALAKWVADNIFDGGPLCNPDHSHLQDATIGFLWTGVESMRHGRRIVGTTELGEHIGGMGKWPRARARQQMALWFGCVPDFVITLDAIAFAEFSDVECCAVIDHELYHCGIKRDLFGLPKFRKDGTPEFALRGHDVEEFTGVVRRYGAGASRVQELVDAALAAPEVAPVDIARVCGNCSKD